MAPINMHILVGEQVYHQIPQLASQPSTYGAFLLGCALVDVHAFSPISRSRTHFSEGLLNTGPMAFHRSCENFFIQLESLLSCSLHRLTPCEQAFIAGYVCHLAADEAWKAHDWYLIHVLGEHVWTDHPVPGGVLLTAFSVKSQELFTDFSSVVAALRRVDIPQILTHIPYNMFTTTWEMIQQHTTEECSIESYLHLLKTMGKPVEEIAKIRSQHEFFWEDAFESISHYFGSVRKRMNVMAQRAMTALPKLYQMFESVSRKTEVFR